ncbi:MAG: sulfatase-like hydrolase/transferase [Pseudomonadota bacterium]|nr:sulfatase-like hydrolase/transferase [Pseudomonadota bacterium]
MLLLPLLLACTAPPPDILLVTLDTTRADAVGVYAAPAGSMRSATPNIDALALNGRVYEEAATVTPLTLPAHASILTGLLPPRHGLRRNGVERLPDATDTLAERLLAHGYTTGAFVSAAVLDPAFGLGQGFTTYDASFAAPTGPLVPSREGGAVTDAFARWMLGVSREAPFFAWVHYYDPHLPNTAHGNGFEDPYLSEVAYMDERVGQALAAARAMDRGRPLVVLVVGDHGEARGDHGEATHGWFVYRSTTRVPFVLVAPGIPRARVAGVVSVVDVTPTLLALAGAPIPEGLDGRDLTADPPPDRVVYGETFTPRQGFGFSELRYAQDAQHRYILAPRPELYDWRADPAELTDLGGAHPAAARLREVVLAVVDAGEAAGSPAAAELAAQLAALGYADGAAMVPTGTPFEALPDPKDDPGAVIVVDALITRARTILPADGVPVLEAALARYPGSGALRASLSRGYELLGRLDDAVVVLAPTDAASDPAIQVRRASLRLAQGRLDDAEALLREGGASPEAVAVESELLRRRGRPTEAVAAARRGLASNPSSPVLLLVAGAALTDLGAFTDAVPLLRRSLTAEPANVDVRLLLGLALAETGDLEGARSLLLAQRARFGASAPVDAALATVEAALGAGGPDAASGHGPSPSPPG